jgi:transcriptional regulator with GAF, ATPase, and Fis domain
MTGSLPGGSSPAGVEPTTVFSGLADIVYRGSTPQEIYTAMCIAATMMVPGCDHASVMLRHHHSAMTAAASDDIASKVDKLERTLNEGPCLDAIAEEAPQVDPDLTAGSQWPTLSRQVVAETPVRGIIGCRLLAGQDKVGALNLLSDAANAFNKVSVERATLLAAFASVAANAVAKGEDAATLRRGLASNREIGKAIGMLMVLNDISEDHAFHTLRLISQDLNVKLAEIAAQIVHRHNVATHNDI